jgi:GMP synthase-like glutamine amidotransferase
MVIVKMFHVRVTAAMQRISILCLGSQMVSDALSSEVGAHLIAELCFTKSQLHDLCDKPFCRIAICSAS